MTDLNLPPRRSLPPETEDRIRRVVDAGMSAAPPNRRRSPLAVAAVAAGVAVLAIGAVVVTRPAQHDDGGQAATTPPTARAAPGPAMDETAMSAALDRCAAAVPGLPPRDQWDPVMGVQSASVSVVGARIGDKPVICQTTEWNVTVTDPAMPPAKSGGTALLLTSEEGVIAGVADPAWPAVGINSRGYQSSGTTVADTRDGFFVVIGTPDWVHTDLRAFRAADENASASWEQSSPLGSPARPPFMVADWPGAVAEGDQELLDQCRGDDPASAVPWVTGAGVDWKGSRLLLVRSGNQLGSCQFEDGKVVFADMAPIADATRLCRASRPTTDEGGPIAGTAPPAAAYAELTLASEQMVRVPVVAGTFVMQAPPANDPLKKVAVYDKNGKLLTEGPLADC